jgi:hypothetical protein
MIGGGATRVRGQHGSPATGARGRARPERPGSIFVAGEAFGRAELRICGADVSRPVARHSGQGPTNCLNAPSCSRLATDAVWPLHQAWETAVRYTDLESAVERVRIAWSNAETTQRTRRTQRAGIGFFSFVSMVSFVLKRRLESATRN